MNATRHPFSAFVMSYADVEALLRRYNWKGITKRDVILAREKGEVPPSLITFLIISHLSHRTQPAYTASCLSISRNATLAASVIIVWRRVDCGA